MRTDRYRSSLRVCLSIMDFHYTVSAGKGLGRREQAVEICLLPTAASLLMKFLLISQSIPAKGTQGEGVEVTHGNYFALTVPEPSTIALLLASAACLLGYGWRRRTA